MLSKIWSYFCKGPVSRIILVIFIGLAPVELKGQSAESPEEVQFTEIVRNLLSGKSDAAFIALEKELQSAKVSGDKNYLWRIYSHYLSWLYNYGRYQRAIELASEGDVNRYWDVTSETTQESLYLTARLQVSVGAFDQAKITLNLILGSEYSLYSHLPRQVHRMAAIELARLEAAQGQISSADARVRRALSASLADLNTDAGSVADILSEAARYFNETRRYGVAEYILSRMVETVAHVRGQIPYFDSALLSIEIANMFALGDQEKLRHLLNKQADVSSKLNERAFNVELFDLYAKHHLYACREGRLADDFRSDFRKVVTRSPAMLQLRFTYIGTAMLMVCAGQDKEAFEAFEKTKTARPAGSYEDFHLSLLNAYFAASSGAAGSVAEALKIVGKEIQKALEPFDRAGVGWPGSLRSDELSLLEKIFAKLNIRPDREKILNDAEVSRELFVIAQLMNRERARISSTSQLARSQITDAFTREEARSRERLVQIRNDYVEYMVIQLSSLLEDHFADKAHRILDWPEVRQKEVNGAWIELSGLEFGISGYDESLLDRAPQYFENTRQSPIDLHRLQQALIKGERVVHATIAGNINLSFCIGAENVSVALSLIDIRNVDASLKLIRASLDLPIGGATAQSAKFSFIAAQELSKTISPRLTECTANASTIQIIPDPDWVNVPFMAIPLSASAIHEGASHKDVRWLGREFPLVVQSSASALVEARAPPSSIRARKALLSISDPALTSMPQADTILLANDLFATRGSANRDSLRALPALPETRDEALAISRLFPREQSLVLFGEEASERELRSLDLRDYRVIHIASHALVAGELSGFSEPGIVLTPGSSSNPFNDGFLSLTEVYGLSFDADVIILSACNTASADGRRSARGLSGLANAFLFAGARSVVASQWPVISQQAVPIVSDFVFRLEKAGEGPSVALNQAIKSYLDSAANDDLAHPRFWGVFIVVGGVGVSLGAPNTPDENLHQSAKSPAAEVFAREPRVGEVLGYDANRDDGSGIAVGMYFADDPKAEQVGGYLARVSSGSFDVFFRDELFAARLVRRSSDRLYVVGTYPSESERRLELKALRADGREIWKWQHKSSRFSIPLDMLVTDKGLILAFQVIDFFKPVESNEIHIVKVNSSGKLIDRKILHVGAWLKDTLISLKAKFHTSDSLTVLLNEYVFRATPSEKFDLVFGARKRICGSRNQVSHIFDVDVASGQARKITEIEGVTLARSTFDPVSRRTFVVGHQDLTCRYETALKIFELQTSGHRSVLEMRRGFNVVPSDVAFLDGHLIVVGTSRIHVDYDPIWVLAQRANRTDEVRPFKVDARSAEENWDTPQLRNIGFSLSFNLATGRTTNATFLDNRARGFIGVTKNGNQNWVGWGQAAGRAGWVVFGE